MQQEQTEIYQKVMIVLHAQEEKKIVKNAKVKIVMNVMRKLESIQLIS